MKNKKKRYAIKICVAAIVCPIIILLGLLVSMGIMGLMQFDKNIEYQSAHMEYLENEYYSDSYVPCDEQKLADFDIEKAMADNVKINEIAVLGTHNSYQLLANLPNRLLMKFRSDITLGKKANKMNFEMDTLTMQLEYGVRNLELDIQVTDKEGEIDLSVIHKPIIDNVSSAQDFATALREVVLWSDNNPGHLPVYLLIEPKNESLELLDMVDFSVEYSDEMDKTIKEALGDKLLTPKAAMGDFDSFEQMRKADAWPTLKEAAGKIIVLLHPCDATEDYVSLDPTLSSQAMFPMLNFEDIDKPYASFVLDNEPDEAIENNKKTVGEYNLMVRTRADSYPYFSDERYALADDCASHIITTDYPPRSVREADHTYSFDGYAVKLLK